MQEFVFRVPKADSSVAIKLKSFRVLSRNPTIGTALFSLSDIRDGIPARVTSKMDEGGLVEAIFCRLKVPDLVRPIPYHKMHDRLSSLRFVLEKNVYFPGDVVRGYVRYFERYKTAISVLLSFQGHSRVYLTAGSDDPVYQSTVRHLRHTSVLFGSINPTEGLKVQPQFLFQTAFEFRLPTDLPPSYEFEENLHEAQIRYSAVLMVQRSRFLPKQVSIPFRVLPLPRPPCLDVFRSAINKLSKQKDIHFSIEGVRELITGGSYRLKVVINNSKSPHAIQSLKLKLRVYGQYRAEDSDLVAKKTVWVIHFANGTYQQLPADPRPITMSVAGFLPISAGENKEVIITLPVPHELNPTLAATQCPIIQTQLYLEAKITTFSMGGKPLEARVALPVEGLTVALTTKIPSAANALQCLAYGLKASDILTTAYVPPLSGDGRRVTPSLSMHYGHFDFSGYGETIEPEPFLGHDSRFMMTKAYDKDWVPGTLPACLIPAKGVPPVPLVAQQCNITAVHLSSDIVDEESSSSS